MKYANNMKPKTRIIPVNQLRPKHRLWVQNVSGMPEMGVLYRVLEVKPEVAQFRVVLEGNQWIYIPEGELIEVKA